MIQTVWGWCVLEGLERDDKVLQSGVRDTDVDLLLVISCSRIVDVLVNLSYLWTVVQTMDNLFWLIRCFDTMSTMVKKRRNWHNNDTSRIELRHVFMVPWRRMISDVIYVTGIYVKIKDKNPKMISIVYSIGFTFVNSTSTRMPECNFDVTVQSNMLSHQRCTHLHKYILYYSSRKSAMPV